MSGKAIKCVKRPIHRYEEDALENALHAVKEDKLSIREACRKFKVPKSTVIDKIKGRSPCGPRRMGPKTILSTLEEEKLVNWLIRIGRAGFPRKRSDLFNTVAKIVKAENRVTPFTSGRPGNKWYYRFLKRHPELCKRTSEDVNPAPERITEGYIRNWFSDLRNYLAEINALDILFDGSRILNGDETSFCVCSKTGRIIGPKRWRNIYEVKSTNERETMTVFLVFSANGFYLSPMVVFPYMCPPQDVVLSMPEHWFLGRSETGWMTSDTFFEYIINVVTKWLDDRHIMKPVLLLVDGHKSHLTMELSETCEKRGIILYALPPNSTHILQPADVSVLKPLKSDWKRTLWEWQQNPENISQEVTRTSFCSLLEGVLKNTGSSCAISDGFRECGIFPFSSDAIDYRKCVQNPVNNMCDDSHEIKSELAPVVPLSTQSLMTRENIDTAQLIIEFLRPTLENKGIDVNVVLHELESSVVTTDDSQSSRSRFFDNESKALDGTVNMADFVETEILPI